MDEAPSRYRAEWSSNPRERFLDQFEWDSGDWLYRYRMAGPAYRVTAAEKDALFVAYGHARKKYNWIAFAVVALAFLGIWLWAPTGPAPRWFGSLSYALLMASLLIVDFIAFRVPLRELRTRTPEAPALSRQARQRLTVKRLPVTVLVGTATAAFLLLLFFALERPAIGALGLALIVGSIAALIWAVVQGVRKRRFACDDSATGII